jgi:hypothetical protein
MKPRVLTNFKLAGTRSYRLACSKLFGFGLNVQQVDKGVGRMLVAPTGYSIVQSDQAGAEALVVAYLARPARYRSLFQNGVKPHTYLAMHIFQDTWNFEGHKDFFLNLSIDIKDMVAHPHWKTLNKIIKNSGKPYDSGKFTAHGKSYRMGPFTFQRSCLKKTQGALALDVAECKYYMSVFDTLFPEVIEWQDEVELEVRATRKLTNLFGYPGTFERNFTDSYIREAISWIPQSTVACITHNAAIAIAPAIESMDGYVCNNKHDSLAVMVPDEFIPAAVDLIESALKVTFNNGRDGATFTMGVESQVGKNWGKYSEKNPEGMREYEAN